MEYVLFTETIKELQRVAGQYEHVLVAFSGGKDSLVCLDLACRVFKKVTGFFLYLVPGLESAQKPIDEAAKRYGIEILQYPGILLPRFLKNRLYCSTHQKIASKLWEFSLHELYAVIMQDTGIYCIINGAKEADSIWRKTKYFKFYTMDQVVYPLRKWRKFDVLSYCKIYDIKLPDKVYTSSGIDLSTPGLLRLHDNFPQDFERLCEYFPYAGAVVKRREWYGIK